MISKKAFHMCIIELESSKKSVNGIKIVVVIASIFFIIWAIVCSAIMTMWRILNLNDCH